MNSDILAIKLSEQAQCWDEMVDRIEAYLIQEKDNKRAYLVDLKNK